MKALPALLILALAGPAQAQVCRTSYARTYSYAPYVQAAPVYQATYYAAATPVYLLPVAANPYYFSVLGHYEQQSRAQDIAAQVAAMVKRDLQATAPATPPSPPPPQAPPAGPPIPAPGALPPVRPELGALLEKRCQGCHNGAKASGGLDLSQPQRLDLTQWLDVCQSVKITDHEQARAMGVSPMPKGGQALTDQEYVLFDERLNALYAAKRKR